MLNNVISPHLPLSWITVTSPEGKSTCFHCSVSMLFLIKRMERVLFGSEWCVVGYTGTQSLEAIDVPKFVIAGSWRATMSMPLLVSAALEMRSCWQVRDLLTFCCHMEIVSGFLVGALVLSCWFVVVLAISPILGAHGPLQGCCS